MNVGSWAASVIKVDILKPDTCQEEMKLLHCADVETEIIRLPYKRFPVY